MNEQRVRGIGVIFHIDSTDQFMFFLRDDKANIPFPNKVDIIGGHIDEDEIDPRVTALRELAEELEDPISGEPYVPVELVFFKTYIDERDVEQNIFGCELSEVPDLKLNEGQCLVFIDRSDLDRTDFAFGFSGVVLEYANSTLPDLSI